MCGILGSVNAPFDEQALNIIAHRGPDDYGLEKYSFNNDIVTFGHRRLSIVDLSAAGHQPMKSADGRFTLIFNGEIYNHDDLRKRLPEITFRGHSDTETIINYISKFGITSVKDFNGMFAFALLDHQEGIVHIIRDRYGVKPIYYSAEGGKFVFCSEIKPIKHLLGSRLSPDSLSLVLRLRYCPAPYTLFENIHKLRPGHLLSYKIATKQVSIQSYIQPVSKDTNISFEDAAARYGELFEASVKRQLMSDVDVGLLLSGGIDSALVTHFAVKHYPGKLRTFTVGFSELSDANEIAEAKQTADLYKTEHHQVLIDSSQYDDVFRKLIHIIEEPLGTTSTIPLYYLNQLVAKHVKVTLSGQGADEPLGGYARYQGEIMRKMIPSLVRRSALKVGTGLMPKNEKLSRAAYALVEDDVVSRFDKTYALFTYEEIDGLVGHHSTQPIETISYFYDLLKGNGRDPVEALMSNDLRMNLSDDLLLLADKIAMHFSIEGRVPLLDNDLIDFVESLPYQYRLKRGSGKLVHKKFAESCLPASIVHRKKKGFKTPAEKWFKEAIGNKYEEQLTATGSKFSSHFDPKSIKAVFHDHRMGLNREKQIFTLASIYYWMEEFL